MILVSAFPQVFYSLTPACAGPLMPWCGKRQAVRDDECLIRVAEPHATSAPGAGAGTMARDKKKIQSRASCAWESLMKNVTLGNVTMSHRTRERPAECLASLSHSTMIGLPRAQH
ncbi:hypothetical protein EVAR_20727_1 [Eumeta japonica]|uniref:Uncharacterized protein n=1 Tax=Eumeta variegata TaxID=151549 RepID=A0A4C1VBM8_EUMVA|nr:hypothetical protein EVAR_20727_1 [Eumeta japonica]